MLNATRLIIATVAVMMTESAVKIPRAHGQEVIAIDVPAPSQLIAGLPTTQTVAGLLAIFIHPGEHAFVVVATHGSGWVEELPQGTPDSLWSRLIATAAAEIGVMAKEPVVTEPLALLLAIQREVDRQTAGVGTFRLVRLGGRDLVPPSTILSADPVQSPVLRSDPPIEIRRPVPRHLVRTAVVLGIIVLLAAVVLGLAGLWVRRVVRYLIERGNPKPQPVDPSPAPFDRSASLHRPVRADSRRHPAPTSRIKRFVVAILLAVPLSHRPLIGQPVGEPIRVEIPEQTKVEYASPVIRRDTFDVRADVSGSVFSRSVPAARRIAFQFLREPGAVVHLSTFGDTVADLGFATDSMEVEAMLGAVRAERRTRLGDAVLSFVDTSNARGHLRVFLSDFQPDDGGNHSLDYLLAVDSTAGTAVVDTATSRTATRTNSLAALIGLVSATSLGLGVLAGWWFASRSWRRRRKLWLAEHVRVRIAGRVRHHDLLLADLSESRLLLGEDAEALVRAYPGEPLTSLEITGAAGESGAVITLRQRIALAASITTTTRAS